PTAPMTWNSAVVRPEPAPQTALSVHVVQPMPKPPPGFSQAALEPRPVRESSDQNSGPPTAKSRLAIIEPQYVPCGRWQVVGSATLRLVSEPSNTPGMPLYEHV